MTNYKTQRENTLTFLLSFYKFTFLTFNTWALHKREIISALWDASYLSPVILTSVPFFKHEDIRNNITNVQLWFILTIYQREDETYVFNIFSLLLKASKTACRLSWHIYKISCEIRWLHYVKINESPNWKQLKYWTIAHNLYNPKSNQDPQIWGVTWLKGLKKTKNTIHFSGFFQFVYFVLEKKLDILPIQACQNHSNKTIWEAKINLLLNCLWWRVTSRNCFDFWFVLWLFLWLAGNHMHCLSCCEYHIRGKIH